VDTERARALVEAERNRVALLLAETLEAVKDDEQEQNLAIATSDAAEPLTAEGVEAAVVTAFRTRLAALDRAEARLDAGTYGLSLLSGAAIPDDRLEADPAAETTVGEGTR